MSWVRRRSAASFIALGAAGYWAKSCANARDVSSDSIRFGPGSYSIGEVCSIAETCSTTTAVWSCPGEIRQNPDRIAACRQPSEEWRTESAKKAAEESHGSYGSSSLGHSRWGGGEGIELTQKIDRMTLQLGYSLRSGTTRRPAANPALFVRVKRRDRPACQNRCTRSGKSFLQNNLHNTPPTVDTPFRTRSGKPRRVARRTFGNDQS